MRPIIDSSQMCAAAEPAYGVGATGFWVMLFIYSKPVELFDTAFIVLRKNNLILLHWYHHISVMLYAWYSYKLKNASGLWFVAMNYTVHAVMYYYYHLVARRQKPKWDIVVTILQISQMVVGVAVCIMVPYYMYFHEKKCHGMTVQSYLTGVIMYASYLFLFLWFFIGRYCFGAKIDVKGASLPTKKDDDVGQRKKTDEPIEDSPAVEPS